MPTSALSILNLTDPQRLAEQMLSTWRDVIVCIEEQQTRRAEIVSREKVALQDLRDRRELLSAYLDRSFDERREVFGRLFAQADAAIAQRDPATLREIMVSVTALAATSPFRDLETLEATREAIRQKKTWEF